MGYKYIEDNIGLGEDCKMLYDNNKDNTHTHICVCINLFITCFYDLKCSIIQMIRAIQVFV